MLRRERRKRAGSDDEESAAESGDEKEQDDQPTAPKKCERLNVFVRLQQNLITKVNFCNILQLLFYFFRRRSRRIVDDEDEADATTSFEQTMTVSDVTDSITEKQATTDVEVTADRCVKRSVTITKTDRKSVV